LNEVCSAVRHAPPAAHLMDKQRVTLSNSQCGSQAQQLV